MHPLVQHAVHFKEERGALGLRDALQHLIKIVDLDVSQYHAAVMVHLLKLGMFREIHDVKRHQALFFLRVAPLHRREGDRTVAGAVVALPMGEHGIAAIAPEGHEG